MPPTSTGTTLTYLRSRALPLIGRTVIRSLHTAAAALLTLTFLTPFGEVLFLQAPPESCEMSCCSGSHCCCHRMGSSEKHDDPEWRSAFACGSDCARHMVLTGSPSVTVIAARIKVSIAPEAESLQNPSKPATSPSGTAFALFGRPPPHICQAPLGHEPCRHRNPDCRLIPC
jgi:hypothetical protein